MNTSSDGFEIVYGKSGPENDGKYYDGYLEKKEKSKWIRYYCVLKHQNMYFFKDVNTQIKDNYVGFYHLEPGIQMETIKCKKEKFEWVIKAKQRKITFRTESILLGECWVKNISMSMKHEKPSTESHILAGSGPASPTHIAAHDQPIPAIPALGRQGSKYNVINQKQLESLQALDGQRGQQVEVSRQEVRVELDRLGANKNWYLPSHSREEAERILNNEFQGTFVVRDYIDNNTKKNKGYVISLKDETNQIRHHRIEKREGVLVLKGYELKSFKTIHDLLEFFIMSQKSRIGLIPYDPNKPVSPPQLPHHSEPSGYEHMGARSSTTNGIRRKGRSQSFQDRRLPEPPPSEGVFPSASIRDHTTSHHQDKTEPQSRSPYMQMKQTQPLPPSPAADQSYFNMSPMSPVRHSPVRHVPNSSYQNIEEESLYENTGVSTFEDPPPILPRKLRAGSLPIIQPYVNIPASNNNMAYGPPFTEAYLNMNGGVRSGR